MTESQKQAQIREAFEIATSDISILTNIRSFSDLSEEDRLYLGIRPNELFDNGDGFETLKSFLRFRLKLNFIDSKTQEAEARLLDDNYRRVTSQDESPKRSEPDDIDFE